MNDWKWIACAWLAVGAIGVAMFVTLGQASPNAVLMKCLEMMKGRPVEEIERICK